MLGSHIPKIEHPHAYKDEDIQKILNIRRRPPEKPTFEIWCDIQSKNTIFKPCYMTVLRILRRNNCEIKYTTNKKKKHDKPYNTPTEVGIKRQVDVKFVPKECKLETDENKYYQYTILDECSRKRYLYFTNGHSMFETVLALKEAIDFFGYKPKEIQTDNGFEFSKQSSRGKDLFSTSYLDKYLNKLNIFHHFIRPKTPEHNGKS